MQLLGHITEEASRAIGVAMALLLVAAITVVVFAIWAVAMIIRSRRRRQDSTRDSRDVND
jgi:hypothetical protein